MTEVKVKRSGYELDWEITIGGIAYTLKGDETVLPYREGKKIDLHGYAKTTALTIDGGQILVELTGGGITVSPTDPEIE